MSDSASYEASAAAIEQAAIDRANPLTNGRKWYSRGRGPERQAILRGLRIGTIPKGRRIRVFAQVEQPPGSGLVTEYELDKFVNLWWQP